MTSRTLHGFLWTSFATGANVLSLLLVVIVLAHLLTPEDFGLAAAAFVVIGFSAIFSDFGVGPAVVQAKELRATHESTGFWISLAFGLLLAGIVYLAAPVIALFFQMDGLVPLLRFLALLFPVQGLGIISDSLLQRELRFRTLAMLDIVTFVIGYGIVGILLAAGGFAAWSLVVAYLAQTSLRALLLVMLRPHAIWPIFEWHSCVELFHFGIGFTAGRFSNYFAGQAEHLIIGRWLGPAALGIYGRAYQLMAGPAVVLGNVLDRVLFPTMVHVQHQPKRLAHYYRRNVAWVALVILPVSVMVTALASEIVQILLGDNWNAVVVPLQILSIGMLFRCSCKISDSLVRATGAVFDRTWRQTAYALLVVVGAWIGQRWGVEGVALAVLITLVLNFLLMAHLALRLAQMSWASFVAAHIPGLRLAALIGLPVMVVDDWLRGFDFSAPVVVLLSLVTAAPFLLAAFYLPRFFVGRDGQWLARKLTGMASDAWRNLRAIRETPSVEPIFSRGEPLRILIDRWKNAGIRYCRWKSRLDESRLLGGQGDLDLLVARDDFDRFLHVAREAGFHVVRPYFAAPSAGEVHLYGLDRASGVLLHLHLNLALVPPSRVLTRSLEDVVLENSTENSDTILAGMPVITPGAELVVTVMRALVAHAKLAECPRLYLNEKRIRSQLHALLRVDAENCWRTLVESWLPSDAQAVFVEGLAALQAPGTWLQRYRIARRFQVLMGQDCEHGGLLVDLLDLWQVLHCAAWTRITGQRGTLKRIPDGGRVIAIIGPDASGKSTMVAECVTWLRGVFPVTTAHLGKPPSTWLTWLPNTSGRLLGRIAPALRTFHQRYVTTPEPGQAPPRSPGLLFRIRAVLLAWDRRAHALRLADQAAKGKIVVCDRYPTACVGAPDSARLPQPQDDPRANWLGKLLARLENRLYRDIPPPDVVVCLKTSLQAALDRNRQRDKPGKEGDSFVERRHNEFFRASFGSAHVIELDTSTTRTESLTALRERLWPSLFARNGRIGVRPSLQLLATPGDHLRMSPNPTLVVEFIGVTGVGKSTLIAAVLEYVASKGIRAQLGEDAILASCGLSWPGQSKHASLLLSALSIRPFIRFFFTRDGARLSRLALMSILRGMASWWTGLSLWRNFVKRIGTALLIEELRHQGHVTDIIIWDEGAVHAAHNLFVHSDPGIDPDQGEIALFASLVPKPDKLIWVTAPKSQTTRVLAMRGHRRVGATAAAAQAFADHAITTFEILAAAPDLKGRITQIHNPAQLEMPDTEVLRARAAQIGDCLLNELERISLPQSQEGVSLCLIA